MDKINILFSEIYDDGTVGGSHSILFNLLTSLDKSIFNPRVTYLNDNIYVDKLKKQGVAVDLEKKFAPSKFTVPLIRKVINWYKLIVARSDYLAEYYRDNGIDLVVINNTLYTAEAYIRASIKSDIPIIIYERGLNTYSNREIKLSKYVSASIPMSDAIYKSVVAQGVLAKQIIRIYDGIDNDNITPKKSANKVKLDLGLPENCRVVGIVGNVKEWKGQKYFIDGFVDLCQSYDDLYALVIGDWIDRDKEYKDELDTIISKHHLEAKVLFTGYRTDIPDLLNVLDVFVHASTRPEPFGMVVPEAMAAKVPVIATNFGGPVESLDMGRCGILVPPKDGHAIAKGIEKYLEDEDYRVGTVRLAYDRYRERFMLDKNVKLAEAVFKDVLAH